MRFGFSPPISWDKFDELFASFSRPYSIYVCSTSIALALPMAIYFKSGDIVISAIAATAGGVVGSTGYFRSVDKKTAASAGSSTVSATSPEGAVVTATTPAPVKG
jgi:hypothetical protein